MPAGNYGSCNHHLGLEICFDKYKDLDYLQARLIEGFAVELRVMQFWSEFILAISNRMSAQNKFDFETTLAGVSLEASNW